MESESNFQPSIQQPNPNPPSMPGPSNSPQEEAPKPEKKSKKKVYIIIIVLGIIVLLAGAYYLYSNKPVNNDLADNSSLEVNNTNNSVSTQISSNITDPPINYTNTTVNIDLEISIINNTNNTVKNATVNQTADNETINNTHYYIGVDQGMGIGAEPKGKT